MEEELTKLQDLLDMGFLQEEEYEERKTEIISKYKAQPAPPKQNVSTSSTQPTNHTSTSPVAKEEELWRSNEEVRNYTFTRGTFLSTVHDLTWDTQNGSRSKGLIIVDDGRTVINAVGYIIATFNISESPNRLHEHLPSDDGVLYRQALVEDSPQEYPL